MTTEKQIVKEAKATGENSESIDAVTPEGGSATKRPADKNSAQEKPDKIDDYVKTPQGTNNAGLSENLNSLFNDAGLSEEFQSKIKTIFEAAINEKVNNIKNKLAEEKDKEDAEKEEKDKEELEEYKNKLAEQVSRYLNYVAEEYVTENKVAIEAGTKVTIAESLFTSVKDILEEHNIIIDSDKSLAVEKMEEELSKLKEENNNLSNKVINIKEEKENLEREIKLNELSEGLTDTQKDRLKTLVEGMNFSTLDEMETKVTTLKEEIFKEATKKPKDSTEFLEEDTTVENKYKQVGMASLVEELKKLAK